MKIKLFEESKYVRKYWLIPTDKRLETALREINYPFIKRNLIEFKNNEDGYIYICYDTSDDNHWGWMPLSEEDANGKLIDSRKWFKKHKYKGYFSVTLKDEEIENIDLIIASNKYGL